MFNRYRWTIGALMFLAGIINYLDRSALGVAAPFIARDLQLDPAQLGIVFSSFSFGYAAFCFVGGYASDRFGPKTVMSVAMITWSVFCGLTAVTWSLASLLIVRIIFGMGEGPIGSTFNKLVRNGFPHRQQASAVSFANAGTPLGAALSGPVVGFLAIAIGWRTAFIAIALLGLVWVGFWLVLATDRPENNPRVDAEERAELVAGQVSQPSGEADPGLGSLIRRPAVLATAFAFFGYSCILFFFINWFPTYLTTARQLSVKSMAFATMIPWGLGFLGLALGGPLCDLLFRVTGNPLRARKIVLVTCLIIAAGCIAVAGAVASVTGAVALMAVSVFFMYLTGNTYWAVILDTVDEARVGGVSGFVHLVANCGGVVAPLATGFIVQATGSFVSAFTLTGAIAVAGALGVALFVHAPATAPGKVATALGR